MNMILVVTESGDNHADLVIEDLMARGADVVRFASSTYPTCARLSLACGEHPHLTLELQGRTLDLDAVRVAWVRRPDPPRPHPEIEDARQQEYARLECGAFVADVLAALRCPLVPGPSGLVQRAQLKGSQLRVAASLGFAIPDTLVTSDRAAALAFWQRHQGRVLAKLPNSVAFHQALGQEFARYAGRVTHRDLMHLDDLRFAPVTFQSYVEKRVELRATVVGQEVWTAEIDSQASNQASEDWRHYDLEQTPHAPHALPEAIRRRCVDLVHGFGLRYGAIDMILTPDGQYVFLELNPNGQYLWLEEVGGLPLTRAMADLLVDLSKDES